MRRFRGVRRRRGVGWVVGRRMARMARAAAVDSVRAIMMIRAYRVRGHLLADLDPLALDGDRAHPELDPAHYGFMSEDMGREVFLNDALGLERACVRDIVEILRRAYCGRFAVEFMHISDPDRKGWIQARVEGKDKDVAHVFTPQGKRAILWSIIDAGGV